MEPNSANSPGEAVPKAGRLTIAVIAIANAATIISGIESVRSFLVSTIGFGLLLGLTRSAMFFVLLGYTAALVWLLRKWILRSSSRRQRTYGLVSVMFLPAIVALNLWLLPREPTPEEAIDRDIPHWIDRIFTNRRSGGGISPILLDASVGPQAWTTAQCLKAILASGRNLSSYRSNLRSGFEYIERARRKEDPEDPGSEGWAYFEDGDWGVTEIAGWVIVAEVEGLETKAVWTDGEIPTILERLHRDLDYLVRRQADSGGWGPAGPGVESSTRTYSTAMAVWAMIEIKRSRTASAYFGDRYDESLQKGISWLLANYVDGVGWVPNPNRRPQTDFYPGLTAQIVFILTRGRGSDPVFHKAKRSFLELPLAKRRIDEKEQMPDADVHIHGTGHVMEASNFLWFPWTLAAYSELVHDTEMTDAERDGAAQLRDSLVARVDEVRERMGSKGVYEIAENLYGIIQGLAGRIPLPTAA